MSTAPDSTAPASQDDPASVQPRAATAPMGTRTLYERPNPETRAPIGEKAQARRQHLQAHARRAGARREALLAILCSDALAELVHIDPMLKRDVSRLMAFVMDDAAPPV
jgi:hypothetical protein